MPFDLIVRFRTEEAGSRATGAIRQGRDGGRNAWKAKLTGEAMATTYVLLAREDGEVHP